MGNNVLTRVLVIVAHVLIVMCAPPQLPMVSG